MVVVLSRLRCAVRRYRKISGRKPFVVGKPSPWIIRAALNTMQAHSEETVIVGDNLRTDILAGFRAGLETILGAFWRFTA